MNKSMVKTLIEGLLFTTAMLILWLAPASWRPAAYVLVGLAVLVALSALLDSQRRTREAQARVDEAKRNLDELRKKSQ